MNKHQQSISDIKNHYEQHKELIQQRLSEFSSFTKKPVVWTYNNQEMKLIHSRKSTNERLFEELTFCILAANTSAEMGMTCVDILRPYLQTKTWEELKEFLIGNYRFINLRPQFIVHTRDYLQTINFELREQLESIENRDKRRLFLAKNPGVKGIGMKEASHFLRNIGFRGYGIMDKHVVNLMKQCGVYRGTLLPTTPKNYLKLEYKYLKFSEKIGIDPDELDLALWSFKTGKVLK